MEGLSQAILYNYSFQSIYGLIVSIILWKLYVKFKVKNQLYWCIGWLGLGIYYLLSFLNLLLISKGMVMSPIRTPISFLAMNFGFVEVIFFFTACLQVIKNTDFSNKVLVYSLSVALIITCALVIPYHGDPTGGTNRLYLRIGVRALFIGLTFFACSFMLVKSRNYQRTYGSIMVSVFFFLNGVLALWTFIIHTKSFVNPSDDGFGGFYLLSMSDFLFHAIIGIAMVIWQLENEQLKLKKTNSDLDGFIYRTSHDLRAPIASALGMTNIAKLEVKDELSLSYFKIIEERMNNLDVVIHDILLFSKSSKLELSATTFDLNLMIDELKSELMLNEKASMIDFQMSLENKETIYCDPLQLKIILQNLLNNAIDFHDTRKENPFVKISIEKTATDYKIIVEDNGQGIKQTEQGKIFKMFYRANENSQGTGLGLYIVKEALIRINGKISLKSDYRIGSIFTVSLPIS